MNHPHHTFLRTIGHLDSQDRTTEWWTVTNENAFYAMRDAIPFQNLFVGMEQGGLVIYLDKPRPESTLVPELLRALKDARAWIAMYRDLPGHDAAAKCMLRSIDPVISKAERGQA